MPWSLDEIKGVAILLSQKKSEGSVKKPLSQCPREAFLNYQAFFFGANALESTRVKCRKIEFFAFKIEFFAFQIEFFAFQIEILHFKSSFCI